MDVIKRCRGHVKGKSPLDATLFALKDSMIPCPTYRVALECLPRLTRSTQWSQSCTLHVSRRTYSTVQNANDLVSPRHRTLTLLHKVSKFLPMVPKRQGASEPSLSLQHRVSQLHQELSTVAYERPVKIVGACNTWCGRPTIQSLQFVD